LRKQYFVVNKSYANTRLHASTKSDKTILLKSAFTSFELQTQLPGSVAK